MRPRCLSFHATYRCRHTGACCDMNWEIPVEPRIVEAVTARRVLPVYRTAAPFAAEAGQDGRAVHTLARDPSGRCGFRQDDRCGLQSAGGEAMLPGACRHFPRLILQDVRGTSIGLSHFCPTAAALLLDGEGLAVVEAAPPLALAGPLEGLDAREALPPLLHPGMLMDARGYERWELRAVFMLASSISAGAALASIGRATERLRTWTPAAGDLAAAVDAAFAAEETDEPRAIAESLSKGFAIVKALTGPHPALDVPRMFEASWRRFEAASDPLVQLALRRYVAAAAFGNWMAYRGEGLRSVLEWIRACHDVLRVQLVRAGSRGSVDRSALIEAVRMADYIVVHTVDSQAFGRAVSVVERTAA